MYIGIHGCTPERPCNDGVGDCDLDSDCKGNLVCLKRDIGTEFDGYNFAALPDRTDVCVQSK